MGFNTVYHNNVNISTSKKQGLFNPNLDVRSGLGSEWILLSLCTITLKFFSTMKQIYFENSFIVVFGFVIPPFLQFFKERSAVKISHAETYLLCRKAEKAYGTRIFAKRKRTKVAIPMVS